MKSSSDFGGSSNNWLSAWSQDQGHGIWSNKPQGSWGYQKKSSSDVDLMKARWTLEETMQEFRMNGFDSPYNPEEEEYVVRRKPEELAGMGPSSYYVRQKSWPEPERTPVKPLPRPRSLYDQHSSFEMFTAPSVNVAPQARLPPDNHKDSLTAEQTRVLSTLPKKVLYSLLRELHNERRNKQFAECRFCKNNGERESQYRSHALKDAGGRVECPVLRAFRCPRCGATGGGAHTLKYCPFSTDEERNKSISMLRSARMASGRRRHSAAPSYNFSSEYFTYGEMPSSIKRGNIVDDVPLDPYWAVLEKKLSS